MGLFGFGGKRKDVVDLAERYRRQKEKEEQEKSAETEGESASPFTFFNSQDTQKTEQEEVVDLAQPQEKKRRLAKRILEMTNKLEDLSNQIYHLQQRIEVLEKKMRVTNFETQ